MAGRVLATFEGVSKSYSGRVALLDLTLSIHAREVCGLIGANGAGKTTALRILCGLVPPDSGRVLIGGADVWTSPIEAKKQLGYVPDGAPLYANLTPEEHLRLTGRLHGLDPNRIRAESARLLDALELEDRARDPVGGFSHGMRQKVAIACALLHRPLLLVMDEPLTGLDAPTTRVIQALLRLWADQGGAVLYTSHQLEVVERVCDRIAVLAEGRLLALGDLDELRSRSGSAGGLEEVFRGLTHTEDPSAIAERIMGTHPHR